ncbi:MAG: glycosyltransferase family 4 protein [Aeromicrobium sp.]
MAHPSADVYGSDLQLLETVSGLVEAGWNVHTIVPSDGPLVPLLRARGATVVCRPFPVLRKALLRPAALVRLVVQLALALPGMVRSVRRAGADTVLVNTVTIPWWLLAGRLTRRLTVCHVHEAEEEGSRAVLSALALPNVLAHRVVVNSESSGRALTGVMPVLRRKVIVVHNGFPGPPDPPAPPSRTDASGAAVIALIARLSPRKGIDIALEAVASLRDAGRDVRLVVCGSTFPGYEWYEDELRQRIGQPDLAGSVELRGYVNPTWPVLAESDIVIVPSRAEPFGNTAVEALLAQRPLVVSAVQGLAEIVQHDVNGLLARADDAVDLAGRIAELLDDPVHATALAATGRADALRRFSSEGYRTAMLAVLSG